MREHPDAKAQGILQSSIVSSCVGVKRLSTRGASDEQRGILSSQQRAASKPGGGARAPLTLLNEGKGLPCLVQSLLFRPGLRGHQGKFWCVNTFLDSSRSPAQFGHQADPVPPDPVVISASSFTPLTTFY